LDIADDHAARATRPTWPARIVRQVRRDLPLALIDVAVVFSAYLVTLFVLQEGAVHRYEWTGFWSFIPFIVLVHLLTSYLFGLYGQMWRYASIQEARRVLLAGTSAGLVNLTVDMLAGKPYFLPRSVIVFGAVLATLGQGSIRFQSRLFAFRRRSVEAERSRLLLVGAGEAGAMVLRDILRNPSLNLDPVAIVDDDPRKRSRSLHGVRVVGGLDAIPRIVERQGIDQVLLAIPTATSELVRQVAESCEGASVTLRVLPTVRDLVGGRVSARDIRDLRIEDLLGRQQVKTDLEAVRRILEGSRVLVTGAGGSIGSEIAHQVAAFKPAALMLLDHDETHLHDVMLDLAGVPGVEQHLADVRDLDRMLSLFLEHRPQVVFHAAAHKHVPVLETHPQEALRTNVLGTANVVDAAVIADVERFVLISTDKAVRPSSVMGASKWFAEQVVRSAEGAGVFCAVRFGNVLGSRGSVIPTFFKQIRQGGPVTITDPEMARYFMSVQEAVQLVLQAGALSSGGEVFTLEMGEPVKILDLARKVVRLSGHIPDKDVSLRVIGVRPGEKLVEDLLDDDEHPGPSPHPGITVSRPAVPDPVAFRRSLRELESLDAQGGYVALAGRMKALSGGVVDLTVHERRIAEEVTG
jgi:FlaA1/EpsC-like NDP-sugar epimerase